MGDRPMHEVMMAGAMFADTFFYFARLAPPMAEDYSRYASASSLRPSRAVERASSTLVRYNERNVCAVKGASRDAHGSP